MKRIATAIAALALMAAPAIAQTSVSLSTPMSRPESMAVAADGTLYIGSQLDGRIYRARPGQATAEQFIDLRPSAFMLGVYLDTRANTLYACEIKSVDRDAGLLRGNSVIRGFDPATGAAKVTIPLPDKGNLCNDFTNGPDGSLYIADTANGQVFRLRPGATQLEKVVQSMALFGVDGLTFLDGALYVNTVFAGNLYRIPMDANGVGSNPVPVQVPRLLAMPDGMRAYNGRIYMAESGNGTVTSFTVKNDVVTNFTTVTTGLTGPTAVEPHGNVVWTVERPAHRVTSVPIK